MGDITVLITGAGAPGAPGIIKSLRLVKERKIRIIGVDMDLESSGFAMVDGWYKGEIAESKDFIPRIIGICKEERVDVVIPLVTNELMKFAKSVPEFEEIGTKVAISSPKGLEIANNKYLLMKICKENNLPTPRFYKVQSWGEFEDAVYELGYPKLPVCFKPPVSRGLRGFRILKEDIDRLDLLMNYKPTDIFTSLEGVSKALKNAEPFPELLVMEYLPGKEYSVDVLVNEGNALIVIPRLREKLKMGISFVGTTEDNEAIIKYSKKVVNLLGLHGNIGLQFKSDANNIPKIIESNPRVQGTIVLCTAAGVNMVYDAVKLALNEEIKECQEDVVWGVKMVRYWDEVYLKNGKYISI
jgi:carbamoyl-phosphate synthase large subunit